MTDRLERLIDWLAALSPADTFLFYDFNVRALLAIVLVSLICGTVSSLVVGNRMAFFSDALAHCAFAGLALGLLLGYAFAPAGAAMQDAVHEWLVPLVMVTFGILVGVLIAYVREKTHLASDTVIGVFFAGAIGLGAMFIKLLSQRRFFSPEGFLFGDPALVTTQDLLILFLLAVVVATVLSVLYNHLVFTSFNSSLARSRRVPVRLCNYLFIVLLALIVNLCLKTVGALLINALLIVPAATASNLCRNMRQLFWVTTGLCLIEGILGHWLSWEVRLPPQKPDGRPIDLGIGGTIVVVSVLMFYLSMLVGPWVRGRRQN